MGLAVDERVATVREAVVGCWVAVSRGVAVRAEVAKREEQMGAHRVVEGMEAALWAVAVMEEGPTAVPVRAVSPRAVAIGAVAVVGPRAAAVSAGCGGGSL